MTNTSDSNRFLGEIIAEILDGVGLPKATEPEEVTLAALHHRLESAAAEAGLLQIAYTTVDSPLGKLLLATTERGLVRIAFENEGHDEVLDSLGQRLSPRILRSTGRFDKVHRQLDEYFTGQRTRFELALDLSLSKGFRLLVQQHLPVIAYGSTESYKQVAESVGSPKAVRAVGTACATNPLPVIVPCHRVLRTDGTLGGYVGGLPRKAELLALETSNG